MADEKKKYKVKEGQTFGANNEYTEGDIVELTEAEAAGFEDKLEPADTPAPRVPRTEPKPPAGATPAPKE